MTLKQLLPLLFIAVAGILFCHNRVCVSAQLVAPCSDCIMGDINGDGVFDLLDVEPFYVLVHDPKKYHVCGDFNGDNQVNHMDVDPFINALLNIDDRPAP